MSGGSGGDTYYVDNLGDRVFEANVVGIDTVYSAVSFSIASQFVENIVLTGVGSVNAVGNSLNNSIVGNGGNNIIGGGAGVDTMNGGAGHDTYYVESSVLDHVIEASGQGSDTVYSSVSRSFANSFVETNPADRLGQPQHDGEPGRQHDCRQQRQQRGQRPGGPRCAVRRSRARLLRVQHRAWRREHRQDHRLQSGRPHDPARQRDLSAGWRRSRDIAARLLPGQHDRPRTGCQRLPDLRAGHRPSVLRQQRLRVAGGNFHFATLAAGLPIGSADFLVV